MNFQALCLVIAVFSHMKILPYEVHLEWNYFQFSFILLFLNFEGVFVVGVKPI